MRMGVKISCLCIYLNTVKKSLYNDSLKKQCQLEQVTSKVVGCSCVGRGVEIRLNIRNRRVVASGVA